MSAALPSLASAASARADFNGDGSSDLAVGAPNDDQGSAEDAGVISVIYASGGGLSPTGAKTFNQGDAGGTVEAGDGFGWALETGDFNGDERADLAVGALAEVVDGVKQSGAVNILYGSASGLITAGAQQFTHAIGGNLGASLAAGDFNQDGRDDLAAGAPVVDEPGEGPGAIVVLYGSGGGLGGATQFTQDSAGGTAEGNEAFGFALAAGRFNGDKKIDLAIGTIGEKVGSAIGAGAINVMYGSSNGLSSTGAKQFTQKDAGGAAETEDYFGWALAAGNFNGGRTDLAVGAPTDDQGSAVDAGVVSVFYASGNSGLSPTGAKTYNQKRARGAVEAGDTFGLSLAAGDFGGDGRPDLAVGAPNDDQGSAVDAGVVSVVYAGSAGLSPTGAKTATTFNQQHAGGAVESDDQFGRALAAADFGGNSRVDLAVGVFGEDINSTTDAGYAHVLYGEGGGILFPGSKFSQQSAGGVVEAGDNFGWSFG